MLAFGGRRATRTSGGLLVGETQVSCSYGRPHRPPAPFGKLEDQYPEHYPEDQHDEEDRG
jgi:hypothetical protein